MIVSRDVVRLAARLLRGEKILLPFRGNSMWPTIEDGDTIILRSVDPAELRPGMIAVGIYPKALIVHRIVDVEISAKGERLFTFDADHGTLPDRVPASRILGLAEARVPRLGGTPVTLLPATELLSRSRWWQWLASDSRSSHTRRALR